MHAFREKCIASDLARKALEDKLSVDNNLNTEKYRQISQCKEESSRTVQLKNEIEGGMYLWKFLRHFYAKIAICILAETQIFVYVPCCFTFYLLVFFLE